MACRRLRREEYTVRRVCALPIELATAQEILEEHEDVEQDENDNNPYSLGCIGDCNVVNPAAAVAMQMRLTFRSMQFGLMVGIGAGVPRRGGDLARRRGSQSATTGLR